MHLGGVFAAAKAIVFAVAPLASRFSVVFRFHPLFVHSGGVFAAANISIFNTAKIRFKIISLPPKFPTPMKKTTTPKKRRKTILWVLGICIVAMALVVGVCNRKVNKCAEGRMYQNVSEIPYRRVGLVLGTTPKNAKGIPNLYYRYRMEAAAELYHAGKVSYLIVSGDNHKREYNEPECMRKSLIALGVPDSVIYSDFAGFRTFDSMVRCKEVFGQDSVTVISQRWHNQRAVYIAQHKGLDAIAYNANDVDMKWWYVKSHTREMLAKVKVVLDVAFGKQPKFLGEPIIVGV